MKTRWTILLAAVALVGVLAVPVFSGTVGSSDIGQYYMKPAQELGESYIDANYDVGPDGAWYPEAMAKVTYNCATGEVVLRAHGLEAGQYFILYTQSAAYGEAEEAVGNGVAGPGNNVLIKTNIGPNRCSGRFNLWETNASGTEHNKRVLRSEETIRCPGCP